MHLAFVIPGRLQTVSGGYAYDRRMISGLRDAGHQVDVIEFAASDGPNAAATAWAAIPADALPVIDGLGLPEFDTLADALVRRNVVGLIHHPTALETGHGDAERDRLRGIEQHLLPLLHRVIVTSDSTAERLAADFHVDPTRIAVVVPGTENAPRAGGSGGPGCGILSVGILAPRKGHDVLLRALARLFDLDWDLTIAGAARDGVYAQTLRALVEELQITQRVTFIGEMVEDALEALWHRADLFALATHYEGYGMAVAEALKHGLPVAITAGGAVGRLVTSDAGVVCEPGDVVTLSKSLRRMIVDRTLRQEMAEAAWQLGQALPGWSEQTRRFADALI